jgi:hypothetical protein
MEDLSLKEDAYLFLAQMANVLKQGMAPHLPGLMQQIWAVMQESDGEVVWINDEEDDDKGGVAKLVEGLDEEEEEDTSVSTGGAATRDESIAGAEEEEDEEDDDDVSGTPVYDVHTGMLDVKKAATFCMGELAQHTGAAYAPFLDTSMQRLDELAKSFNSTLRQEVASVLPHMLDCALQAAPPLREWAKGDMSETLPPPSRAVCNAVVRQLLGLVVDDDDQDVAAQALQSLQAALERVGPCLLAGPEEREKFMLALLNVSQAVA